MTLDLTIGKRLEGYKPARRRTFGDPGTIPAGLLGSGAGNGGFGAATIDRLTRDFIAQSRSADQALFGDNRLLRARARKLATDNPHFRKFLAMVPQNVVGPGGILLQAKVRSGKGKDTADSQRINERIEAEWTRWCQVGNCTADGRFSFAELQIMAIKNCAREGENLVKQVLGRQFNPTGFALQPLDNDQLDDSMMMAGSQGGEIRMGVEVDQYRRPQAYHLWSGHPNDLLGGSRERIRVPAGQIVHTAIWERPGQTRGYTWGASAILSLNQYSRYEEAVVVAARTAAAKSFAIERDYPEGYDPFDEDEQGQGRNPDGTELTSGNAGEGWALDYGEHLNFVDPRFPTQTHKDFTQTMLRNIASGLLISYPSLANDLEGVNFSSIRAGLLDERDGWRVLQRWFIDHFCWPVFLKWLEFALLTTLSDVTLTPDQMRQMEWRARGWEWVDPVKDADAAILRLSNGFSTYSRELALLGLDFEETVRERAAEQKVMEGLQAEFELRNPVVLGTDLAGDQGGKGVAAGDESEAAEVDGGQGGASKGKGSGK